MKAKSARAKVDLCPKLFNHTTAMPTRLNLQKLGKAVYEQVFGIQVKTVE